MWLDPVGNTPRIVQVDFGAWGQYVPGDGEVYCAPTSLVMALYWLYANGFTQLAPGPFVAQDDGDTINLELVIAGLMDTSSEQGTVDTLEAGIVTYLSACGIAPSQYSWAYSGNPDLTWLATQLAPNVAPNPNPSTIVLADFAVGWFSGTSTLVNQGGHVLCPLTVDVSNNQITLNNPYPASFFDVPNEPTKVQQKVTLKAVPAGLILPPVLPLPSDQYTQVVSGNKGHGNGEDWAILWSADAWVIQTSALPSTPDYAPTRWQLDLTLFPLNTNGGTLNVLAPLVGNGNFCKCGAGTLMFNNINQLSGVLAVQGGTVGTTLTSGTPFGIGSISLQGGALVLSDGTDAVKMQIASSLGGVLMFCTGGGTLHLLSPAGSPALVTIGGNTDGKTANLQRIDSGTLQLQPSQGLGALGADQQVLVAGSDGNLPIVSNGMVAPHILGRGGYPDWSGAFLTYGSAGFAPASTVSSSDVPINSVTAETIYQVVDAQTIDAGATVQVAALEMAGGTIDGSNATLQVGGQAAGDFAGLIMNGGTISAATLAFGATEAVIYAANPANVDLSIDATLSGTGGLTLTGPGTVTLTADSSSSLSGPIMLNSGTLAVAGSGSTGSGAVTVSGDATLNVTGTVDGAVNVGQSGVLSLNGGTVQGDVTIIAIGQNSGANPGGILEGAGTLNGTVQAEGNIQAGPTIGILKFTNTLTLPSGSAFYWRLAEYADNASCPPGVVWNALQISRPIWIGASIFLDFSLLGEDPDGGNPFWDSAHIWTIWSFETDQWNGTWGIANAFYLKGDFTYSFQGSTALVLYLNWTPLKTKRTPAERLAAQASAIRPTITGNVSR